MKPNIHLDIKYYKRKKEGIKKEGRKVSYVLFLIGKESEICLNEKLLSNFSF